METLTRHKKFVRALAKHPTEYVALLPVGLFYTRTVSGLFSCICIILRHDVGTGLWECNKVYVIDKGLMVLWNDNCSSGYMENIFRIPIERDGTNKLQNIKREEKDQMKRKYIVNWDD
ncbi:hypothetical protein Tco_1337915 [Tanacetum coccineum]